MNLTEEKFKMFENRLSKVYRHFSKMAKRQLVSCYRIYDHDLPEFPLCVEIYEGAVYVAEYQRKHGFTIDEYQHWLWRTKKILTNILAVNDDDIYIKTRKRIVQRSAQYRKQEHQSSELIVNEGGLKFLINLSDYLDTGLFLDHRITRNIVRGESSNKHVLNLFAYTGSFSVYAADGGAKRIDTVDLSNTYIHWAKRNMALNGFTSNSYNFIQADVLKYIYELPENFYDIIILDPPTFSNSKKMTDVLDIQNDHPSLINRCIHLLRDNGTIYFSTNYKSFTLQHAAIVTNNIKDITRQTTPFDFEKRLNRYCFKIEK